MDTLQDCSIIMILVFPYQNRVISYINTKKVLYTIVKETNFLLSMCQTPAKQEQELYKEEQIKCYLYFISLLK